MSHQLPPSSAVVGPGDVRVNVRTAPLAANDSRSTKVHHLNIYKRKKKEESVNGENKIKTVKRMENRVLLDTWYCANVNTPQ